MRTRTAKERASLCDVRSIATRAFAVLAVAACVCCAPLDIGFDAAKVDIQRSEAFADYEPGAATSLLESMADVAGLSVGDFVATVAGATAVGTGLAVASDAGMRMGNDAAVNLGNLIDAADYPAWDTLTSEEQANYGSAAEYNGVKFNSLMSAFGLGDLVDGYYSSYTGSGGGSFDPDDGESETLAALGRIGLRWAAGLGNVLGDIQGLVARDAVAGYLGADVTGDTVKVDGTGLEGWPEGFPTEFYVNRVNRYYWKKDNDPIFNPGVIHRHWRTFSQTVYVMAFKLADSDGISVWAYNETPFKSIENYVINPPEPTYDASAGTSELGDYYYTRSMAGGNNNPVTEITLHVNDSELTLSNHNGGGKFRAAIPLILYGAKLTGGGGNTVPDYPETVDEGEKVYYPSEGITYNTTWNEYTTPTEVVRPDNPYNPTITGHPEYNSGTDAWKTETEQNLMPAVNVRFDKLFPFCLIYDIGLFWDKVNASLLTVETSGVETQAEGTAEDRYLTLNLPHLADVFGFEQGLSFDLTPLKTLGNLIRVPIVWALWIWMIMGFVDFWRRVITGG